MKIRPLYTILILLVISVAVVRTWQSFPSTTEKNDFIMGTLVRVKVSGQNSSQLAQLALDEIDRLDGIFSRFNKKSKIYKINSDAKKYPLHISLKEYPDLLAVLSRATRLSRISKGAFDVTLGDYKNFYVNEDNKMLYLRQGRKIDLGGIGKGYAAEKVRDLLLKKGAKSGIIDMRSSIVVFGTGSKKVGIQHPRQGDKLIGAVELKDGMSLATSGDYERGQHIIDPRLGKPAKECQGVTIVGANASVTDALSTTVFVLGSKKGMELIEIMPDIEGLIVDSKGKIFKSSGLK